MAKQLIEIDVPDGWEAVAFRHPILGEYFIPDADQRYAMPIERDKHYVPVGNRVIVRKVWQAPDWIKPGTWLFAPDQDQLEAGIWLNSLERPHLETYRFHATAPYSVLNSKTLDIDFPVCKDFRNSLRQIGEK